MALALKRDSRFLQGNYTPKNPKKFIGRTIPVYRSSIELKFFIFCDENPNVVKWGSENIIIPYFDPVKKKTRRYYVDNYVEIREGTLIKKYLIELKDIKETKKPEKKKGKKQASMLYEQTTWMTNSIGKWPAAQEYCKKHGMEFLLLGFSKKNGFEKVELREDV